MNDHFPDHHVPFDHFVPMVYFPNGDPRFGTKEQMDTAWLVLSAVDEGCSRCAIPAIKEMAAGDVETILVLMRLITFWTTVTIWPGIGSDHEIGWRAHLTDGFATDPGSIYEQREGIIGEFCTRYLNSLPPQEHRNDDYRAARAEHWDAVRNRDR
jgi:hypothetical protein